jgi:transposase-like protein
LNLTLLVVHEHLLPSKIKKPMKMFREYRHIYNGLIHSRSYSHWRWHLDEVFVRINGKTHYLWRAMKRYGQPRVIVTDRLRSYRAAIKLTLERSKGTPSETRWDFVMDPTLLVLPH